MINPYINMVKPPFRQCIATRFSKPSFFPARRWWPHRGDGRRRPDLAMEVPPIAGGFTMEKYVNFFGYSQIRKPLCMLRMYSYTYIYIHMWANIPVDTSIFLAMQVFGVYSV